MSPPRAVTLRGRWLFALLLLPIVDAVLLAYLAIAVLGLLATVLLVVLTALVGLLLVRAEGRRTIRRIRAAVAEGRAPTDELLDGGLLIVAGAFLLTPGLVSDLCGFLLVLPPSRAAVRSGLKRWVIVPAIDRGTGGFGTGSVYVGGFPGDSGPGDSWSDGTETRPAGGQGTNDAGMADGRSAGDRVDGDAYHIEFDDE